MCGLAGIIAKRSMSHEKLIVQCQQISAQLSHRGPDDEGFLLVTADWRDEVYSDSHENPMTATAPYLPLKPIGKANDQFKMAMVHRRLSIIAPGYLGHQPMCTPDERYWISYNGEVFNFRELGEEHGISNVSGTDTEIILKLWEKMGKGCLNLLNGFFAFAIYDKKLRKLFLVRDRNGVKPMYFALGEERFYFASEFATVFQMSGDKELDPMLVSAHVNWARNDYNRHGGLFKNIHALQKGGLMEFDMQNFTYTQESWYAFESNDRPEAAEQLRDRILASVKGRLIADVPLAFAVSGGLDSAVIIGAARKIMGPEAPLRLYSVVSGDRKTDESEWQKIVSEFNHAQWTRTHTDELGPDLIQEMVDHQMLPPVAWNNCAHYLMLKKVQSAGVKVIFNGQGADELFGGYPAYLVPYYDHSKKHIQQIVKALPVTESWVQRQYYKSKVKRIVSHNKQTDWKNNILTEEYLGLFEESFFVPPEEIESADQKMHFDYFGPKLGQMLLWEDLNSMAHGVESRNPFADDHTLAEAWLDVPFADKLEGGFLKGILRRASKGLVPLSIAYRMDKNGFALPEIALSQKHFDRLRSWFMMHALDEMSEYKVREKFLHQLEKNGGEEMWRMFFRVATLGLFLNKLQK